MASLALGGITAGIGALSSIFGNGAQKRLLNDESQAMEFGLGQAKTLIPQATAQLGQAANFWGPLLNGNRNAQAAAVGPEISNISSQYQAGRKAAAEFSGRGGGRSAGLQMSRFNQVGAVTNLLNSLKPQAAEGMTKIGDILGRLGLGAGELGQSAAGGVQSGINAGNQQQAQLGQGVGSILALLMKKKDSSGGGN